MSCAVIAEPATCFPWGYDEDEGCGALRLLLLNRISLLTVEGIREFHVALDDGFGLYAAEIIHSLRKAGNRSEMICYLAWEEEAQRRERGGSELVPTKRRARRKSANRMDE